MMHTYGITRESVTRNNRFDIGLFKEAVIKAFPIGTIIDPRQQCRLALALGAKPKTIEDLRKEMIFIFNDSSTKTRRRRGASGYVYEILEH